MKICIVGQGIMGSNHTRVLKSLGHDVLAVEGNVERNIKARELFDIDTYDTIESTLGVHDLEAYVVATPTTTHYAIAKWILENNPKPMLIEKPVCVTVEQAEEIRDLANQTKTMIAVNHIERHNPIVAFAKTFLQGREVKLINSYRLGSNTRITDVGVISDLAIHDIDVLTYLVGSKIREVSAQHLINPKTGYEQYGKLLFTFENGSVGSSEVSWVHPKKIRKIEIVASTPAGSDFMEADYLEQTFTIHSTPYESNTIEKSENKTSLKKIETLKLQHEDFIAAIQNKTKPLVDLEQGINALRVIEASYESVKTGRVVRL